MLKFQSVMLDLLTYDCIVIICVRFVFLEQERPILVERGFSLLAAAVENVVFSVALAKSLG